MTQIILQLPDDIARNLAAPAGDLPHVGLERLALEGLALEGYREGKLTAAHLRRLLGFQTRMEVDGFLKAHGVELEYTLEDLEQDRQTHRALGL